MARVDKNFHALENTLFDYFTRVVPEAAAHLILEFQNLYEANHACFLANMRILELRKIEGDYSKEIADCEWTARSVGEARVRAKNGVNEVLYELYHEPCDDYGGFDDIVYSVGDMLDRISIELIKQWHFAETKQFEKRDSSLQYMNRVVSRLQARLDRLAVDRSYEKLIETRTYVLNGIQGI